MKITKIIERDITIYFYDGIKKYEHCKKLNGYEMWKEYKDGKEIRYKDIDGNERWSDNNPENPKNWIKEEGVKPFEFN